MTPPRACPVCSSALVVRPYAAAVWGCATCHGALVQLSHLRQHIDHEQAFELWKLATLAPSSVDRACPSCAEPLCVWRQFIAGAPVELDACRACELLWFDAGELERVRTLVNPPTRCTSLNLSPLVELPSQLLVWFIESLFNG